MIGAMTKVLVLLALAGSIAALLQHRERIFPALAVLASGLETLIVFGLLQMKIKALPLTLVLAGLLLVAGVIVWWRSSAKWATTGATVASTVGLVQVLGALKVLS
jgi:hypothetical protein